MYDDSWNDTPYHETCPVCDRDRAYNVIDTNTQQITNIKCFYCGHKEKIVVDYDLGGYDDYDDDEEAEEEGG